MNTQGGSSFFCWRFFNSTFLNNTYKFYDGNPSEGLEHVEISSRILIYTPPYEG